MLTWACLCLSCLRQKHHMFPCLWLLTVHCLCLSDRGSSDAFPISLCTVQRRRTDNIKGTERSVNQRGTCSLTFLTLCWNNFKSYFTKIQLNEDLKEFWYGFLGNFFWKCYDDFIFEKFHHAKTFKWGAVISYERIHLGNIKFIKIHVSHINARWQNGIIMA